MDKDRNNSTSKVAKQTDKRPAHPDQGPKLRPTGNTNNNGPNGKTNKGPDRKAPKVGLNRQKAQPATLASSSSADHKDAIEKRLLERGAQSKPKPYVGLFGSHLPPIGGTSDVKPHGSATDTLPNMGFVFGTHGQAKPPATLPTTTADATTTRQTANVSKKIKPYRPNSKADLATRPPTTKPGKMAAAKSDVKHPADANKGPDGTHTTKPTPARPPTGKARDAGRLSATKNEPKLLARRSQEKATIKPRDAKSGRKVKPPSARPTPPVPATTSSTPRKPPLMPSPPSAKGSAKRRPPVSTKPPQPATPKPPRPPSTRKSITAGRSTSSPTTDKTSPRPSSSEKPGASPPTKPMINTPKPPAAKPVIHTPKHPTAAKPMIHTPKPPTAAKPMIHTPKPPAARAEGAKTRPFPGQLPSRRKPMTTHADASITTPAVEPSKDEMSVKDETKLAKSAKSHPTAPLSKNFGPSEYEIKKAAHTAESDDEANYDYEDDFEDDDSDIESLEDVTDAANTNANHEVFDGNREDVSVYADRVDNNTLKAEYIRWKTMTDTLRDAMSQAEKSLSDVLTWHSGVQVEVEKLGCQAEREDLLRHRAMIESERAKEKASNLEVINGDLEDDNKDEEKDLIKAIRKVNTVVQMIKAFQAGRLDRRIQKIRDVRCAKALMQTQIMEADLDALKEEYSDLKGNVDDDDKEFERDRHMSRKYDVDDCYGALRKPRPVTIDKTQKDPSELVDTADLEEGCSLELFMKERRKKKRKPKNKMADTQKEKSAGTDEHTEYTVHEEIIDLHPMELTATTKYSLAHRNSNTRQTPSRNTGLLPSIHMSPHPRLATRVSSVADHTQSRTKSPTVDLPPISLSGAGKVFRKRKKE